MVLVLPGDFWLESSLSYLDLWSHFSQHFSGFSLSFLWISWKEKFLISLHYDPSQDETMFPQLFCFNQVWWFGNLKLIHYRLAWKSATELFASNLPWCFNWDRNFLKVIITQPFPVKKTTKLVNFFVIAIFNRNLKEYWS